ncbi:MAG: creatininase family protein [Lentisphaerae bacterium]|nr:creatininase family protein [Lentisphaerota bacterium]
MRTHAMGEMTVKEIREYLKTNKTIIVPYGVVEQHGYHLPVSMDIHNAEVPAYVLAEKLGCIVAPPLNYCFSGGQLPGTINVRPTSFCAIMCDIVESLAAQGFENILIYPGHGGSESLAQLKEALRILKWLNASLEKVMIMILRRADHWHAPKDPRMTGADYHAGRSETSLMLAYRNNLVQLDQMEMDEPELAERMRHDQDAYQICTTLSGQPQEIATTRQRPEIKVGVMGYPEFASAEFGKLAVESAISVMAEMVKKAIADADENRKTGKRIEVKSPVLVVEEGSDKIAIKA